MDQFRDKHPGYPGCWVAAHLLNADLGGRGDYTRNLVPMTGTANKNHSSWEQLVKNFCGLAYTLMERDDEATHGYCYYIFYAVKAMDEFRKDSPYNLAPMYLQVSAEVRKAPWTPLEGFKGGGSPITASDPLYQSFKDYTFGTQIHNEEGHLPAAAAPASAFGPPDSKRARTHAMDLRRS